jgi:hypothetical protein
MLRKFCTRLASFYVNFTIGSGFDANKRCKEFLSTKTPRQDDLIKLRRGQYRDLLQSYGLSSFDFKWFTRVRGDSIQGTSKKFT